jgi:hypothetical protein
VVAGKFKEEGLELPKQVDYRPMAMKILQEREKDR